MSAVVADTHTILWYLAKPETLSSAALQALRDTATSGDRVLISIITVIETIYLQERFRIPPGALDRLESALTDPDVALAAVPLDRAIACEVSRIPRDLVPDMPDRIIAATAAYLNLPLVTKDHCIRATSVPTIW